ncbi:hypothetical protein D915_005872 [Fasciola hepatica]|uniref:Uncharacterized protein n=1 Tax=Fasciola hepatica TaxID=6192 RepID=A0A4E0R4G2_FASHE|nr:hypothetical protein D915_005872 [Fasciola hepatica]
MFHLADPLSNLCFVQIRPSTLSKYRPESVISHTNGLCNANTNAAAASAGSTTTSPPGSNSSGCTVPPARPPKPRNLTIDKTSPLSHNYIPVKTKISSQLKDSIALFENGSRATIQNGEFTERHSTNNLEVDSSTAVPLMNTKDPTTVRQGDLPKPSRPVSERSQTNVPIVPTQLRQSLPTKQPETAQAQAQIPNSCSVAPDSSESPSEKIHGKDSDTNYKSSGEPEVSCAGNRLSSCLDRNNQLFMLGVHAAALGFFQTELCGLVDWLGCLRYHSDVRLVDFIVQSDAFRVSPQFLTSNNLEDSLPTLQHAEPIAVATPDEEEDDPLLLFGSEDPAGGSLMPLSASDTTPVNPTLPVPPGLKVVAVDNRGVHILEDGNFFYSVPGLSSRSQSPEEDSHFLLTRSSCHHPLNTGDDRVETHASSTFSASEQSGSTNTTDPVPTADLSLLPDTSTDSVGRQTRVRFSTEPIMVNAPV